jgi:hypothetical protein
MTVRWPKGWSRRSARRSITNGRQAGQLGIQPALQLGRAAWANIAVGLGSVGLGIGATAVMLQSWPTSGAAPKAVLDLG